MSSSSPKKKSSSSTLIRYGIAAGLSAGIGMVMGAGDKVFSYAAAGAAGMYASEYIIARKWGKIEKLIASAVVPGAVLIATEAVPAELSPETLIIVPAFGYYTAYLPGYIVPYIQNLIGDVENKL